MSQLIINVPDDRLSFFQELLRNLPWAEVEQVESAAKPAKAPSPPDQQDEVAVETVWVFHGVGSQFANGVFRSLEEAEAWIAQHRLLGLLTQYPVGVGAYDWAVQYENFKPKKPHHFETDFIQRFANAGMEHYHYEQGKR